MQDEYGKKIKEYRQKMGLTQIDVANSLNVTPGYISNVENGRTAMSLRVLIYYAKLMGISIDSLVGDLEPEYHSNAVDHDLIVQIAKLDIDQKERLLKTLKLWLENND